MRLIDELSIYVQLVDTLSFRRTSESQHVSASTLTRLIQRLERESGQQLLQRDPRGASPTPAGLAFAAFARATLEAWDDYKAGHPSSSITGHVRLYATPTAASVLAPNLLRRLLYVHPEVAVTLETGDAASAIARTLEGSCDLAIVPVPAHLPQGLLAMPITTSALVFTALEDRLRRPVEERRFILPAAGLVRDLADKWFRQHQIAPKIAAEPASHEAMLALAQAGLGVACLPELVVAAAAGASDLVIESLEKDVPRLTIALCTSKRALARPAVGAFWAAAESAAPPHLMSTAHTSPH